LTSNIRYANGINTSLDKKKLFVAAASDKKIMVFDRNTQNGNITQTDKILIDGPDNIELDTAGNLWVGCHPKLLAFLGHAKDSTALSPSQVMKVKYQPNDQSVLEDIYLNNGTPVSASSVGAVWKNRLLIGTVFEKKVLLLEINKQ
jgi:arylesterase / paraoxonase